MSEHTPAPPDVDSTLCADLERRLSLLWRRGQRPDVRQFLAAAGDLSAGHLAAVLAVDQRQRWRAGERPPAEEYLQQYPALRADVERALELVYGEFLHREDLGEAPTLEEYLKRFPQYAARLRQQVELHRALADSTSLDPESTQPAGPDPAARTDRPGARPDVPGYEILGELGRGGMGVVYKARHVALKRVVALKMLRDGIHAGAEERARFRLEAEAVARLQHPNVVQIYEVGEHDGRPFFAMEFVDGGSLDTHLDCKPQPPRAAAELVATLARAVEHAHRQGIVHRDLKPANVLLSLVPCPLSLAEDKGQGTRDKGLIPKITDFGLAKRLGGEGGQTTPPGALLGTPSYMAPEQAASREVGPRADVYALGAILYDMLTGRPPFQSTSLADTLHQVLTEEPVPPRRLQSQVPRDLDTICLKCLEKDPARRYASAAELADDLQCFLEGRPILARPAGVLERARKWARRRPAAAALLAVSALALLVVSAGGWWSAAALSAAAERERQQRRRAEHSFRQAMGAVDQMLTEVGAVDLADVPQMGPVRERLLRRALSALNDFLTERGDDPAVAFEAARASGRCGDILALQGSSEEAERQYARALALLAPAPDAPEQRREWARSANNLGTLLKKQNRFDEAEDAYRSALRFRQSLAAEFADRPEYREELAATRYLLGALLAPQAGRQKDAEECYADALVIQEGLAGQFPRQAEYRRAVARTRNNLGILQRDTGQAEAAGKTFELALAGQRQLVAEAPEVPHYQRELARTLVNRGVLLQRGRNPEPARESFEEARRILAVLVRNYPTVPEYRYELATAHHYLGRLWRKAGQRDRAEAALREAEGLLRDRVPPRPDYRHLRALVWGELGRLLEEAARGREAEAAYRRGVDLLADLARDDPLVPQYHCDLANALENLAWLLLRRGSLEEPARVAEVVLDAAARNPWNVLAAQAALVEARDCLRRAVCEQQAALDQVGPPAPRHRDYLLAHQALLAEANLRLGEHAEAAAVAGRLPALLPDGATQYFVAAEFLARCATLAADDDRLPPGRRQELRTAYAERALRLLRTGIELPGITPREVEDLLGRVKRLPVYEPLRRHPNWPALQRLAESKAKVGVG
jgi:tetratricopeptide (TPR) repeat protein